MTKNQNNKFTDDQIVRIEGILKAEELKGPTPTTDLILFLIGRLRLAGSLGRGC